MRIALLTSAKGWRGSGASYAKIARGLGERGHLAHLITSAPALTARFTAEDLPVTEITARNTGPREIRALLRALRSLQAEAVVVDTPRDLRLSAWATFLHRARIIYRYNLNYRRSRNDLADRFYAARVAACVFQSHFIEEDARRREPWVARVPSYLVPNGYDSTRFAPRPEAANAFREKWRIGEDTPIVLTSAKLERNKGHEVAVAALDEVRREERDVTYVICGNGAREEALRALAAERGIPVRFTGALSTDDLIGALSAADIVVHPSRQEIFPNAVGEAMSCARAVIAADSGGTAELVGRDGSAGVLVPPDDHLALSTQVKALLTDPERRARLGAAARRRIETEFPLRRMINGYESALQNVIDR